MNDDFALFQHALEGVKPLKQDALAHSRQALDKHRAKARQHAASTQSVLACDALSLDHVELIHPEDIVSYKKAGVQTGVFKNLRLGKYELQARLDLHQMRLEQARSALINFINESQRLALRCVLIVHGKGKLQQPPALLKSYVSQWLPQFDPVLALHSCLAQHGGSGALYVLLKKSPKDKLHNRERHAKRMG